MNKRHTRTLQDIFVTPIKANIIWADVEKLFKALGGELEEKAGSIICVKLQQSRALFHRPHPQKEAKKGMVKRVRIWLTSLGAQP